MSNKDELSELRKEIENLSERLEILEEELTERSRKIVLATLDERRDRDQEGQKVTLPEYYDLAIGNWECDSSPIGVCAYNEQEDPVHDDCLFCFLPEERQ